jgi:subtilisin family serine protease
VLLLLAWAMPGPVRANVDDDGALLRLQHHGHSLELPLLEPQLVTALADEPLRLYRFDRTLGLAVGSVVVVATEPGTPAYAGRFAGLAEAGSVLGTFAGVRYHAVRIPDADAMPLWLTRLAAAPGVRAAWPDLLKVEIAAGDSNFIQPAYESGSFSLVESLEVEPLWRRGDGSGVRVAIIDSAVDPEVPGLAARPVTILDPWPDIRAVPSASPGRGHGTRVASVIASVDGERRLRGVAPGVELISIVLRSTWTSELIAALYQAVEAGADIVVCPWDDPLALEPVIELVNHLSTSGRGGRGMLFVAAAGNRHYDSGAMDSFANLESTLSVTALDHRGAVVAAYGRGVDIAAPSMLPVLPRRADGQPSFLGKTSAATPVVAGVAALLLSAYPDLQASDVRNILRQSAAPLVAPPDGASIAFPFGALAPAAAFELAAKDPDSSP